MEMILRSWKFCKELQQNYQQAKSSVNRRKYNSMGNKDMTLPTRTDYNED